MESILGDLSISSIVAGLLFGMVGWIIFKEGKKRTSTELVFIGIGLMVYPYFITNAFLVWIIGIVLSGIAFKLML